MGSALHVAGEVGDVEKFRISIVVVITENAGSTKKN